MSPNTTDLKIAVLDAGSWSRRLTVTVPADRVQRTRTVITQKIARQARQPGFRQGKIPLRVIEQRYGSSIDQETVDQAIKDAYREALESEGITPISQGRIDRVQYDRGTELTFEVEMEIRPEIELTALSGFTVSRPPVTVEEGDVDSVLERLRDERASWEPIEEGRRPDYGDRSLIEIVALDREAGTEEEPRPYRIVVGEGQAIPDVEAAVMTLATGETGEFGVAFPEDFPDETRRGQAQQLRISLREAERKVLPSMDDSFAASLGEFESVQALRERILEDLTEDARQRAEADVRRQLIDQVIEANPFAAPVSMVERYLDLMVGEDPDDPKPTIRSPEDQERFGQVRESLRPQAEWGLKRTLIIERLAEQEGLRASQDEIDGRVDILATRHQRSPSEVWIELEKSGQLEALEREITEEKVFDFLKSQNTVA